MIRLNITLPEELVEQLKHEQNKSRFITEALREKINRDKKKETERLMKEGYRTSSDDDKKLNVDWEKASLEGWE